MAAPIKPVPPVSEELKWLLAEAKKREVTEEELREQRKSWVRGNLDWND